jgi:hypothetical protein
MMIGSGSGSGYRKMSLFVRQAAAIEVVSFFVVLALFFHFRVSFTGSDQLTYLGVGTGRDFAGVSSAQPAQLSFLGWYSSTQFYTLTTV